MRRPEDLCVQLQILAFICLEGFPVLVPYIKCMDLYFKPFSSSFNFLMINTLRFHINLSTFLLNTLVT